MPCGIAHRRALVLEQHAILDHRLHCTGWRRSRPAKHSEYDGDLPLADRGNWFPPKPAFWPPRGFSIAAVDGQGGRDPPSSRRRDGTAAMIARKDVMRR